MLEKIKSFLTLSIIEVRGGGRGYQKFYVKPGRLRTKQLTN